jgi:hypothetical protein
MVDIGDVLPKGYTLIPTGVVKLDAGGLTISLDMDKAPCLMCWGAGEITADDGFDENGYLGSEYDITCPRCNGNGLFRQELIDE